VVCVATALTDLTVQLGPLPLAAEAAALPSGAGRALGTTRAAVADRTGHFEVGDLVPGRYHVEIARAGTEPFRSEELALAPGERRELGALSLRPGIPFEGRVVDEGGIAIEGARVTIEGARGDPSSVFAVSDGGGHFAFALPAGRYQLTASAPGRGAAHRAVDIAGASAPAPLELRLVRAEASLEGLVRDTGGRPLARARVLAWPADAPAPGVPAATAPLATTSTDVGGHFTLRELPAGDVRLEVQHPDYPATVQPANGGQFAQVTVPVPGGISGEVHARVTGAAIPRAHVAAAGPDGAKASADSAKDGAFRLLRLAPGRWRLSIAVRGAPPVERPMPSSGASSAQVCGSCAAG
jgi:hypothetical protein